MSTEAPVRKLRADVAHKIATSQVVVSLMGAARELIDNALDAGATSIEVRLKNSGADALEVMDNGHGIQPEDFDSLGKPHATSKLHEMDDFEKLLTFGFRGEALNALCALGSKAFVSSKVTITTRHKTQRMATKLVFGPDGNTESRQPCPRSVGTSVLVQQLFHSLPVRRKEFVRNAKKEMLRLLNTVQAFALSRTNVRFVVSNGIESRSIQLLASPGNNAPLPQVMASLFGASATKKSLIPLKVVAPDANALQLYDLVDSEETLAECDKVRLDGFVSNCEHSDGRHTADRQFIFINKRPVDHPKLCKIANEVYNVFNRGLYCTLVLFIEVDPAQLDVNVAPDKRLVYLRNEKELFAKFRPSLLRTWESVAGKCPEARALLPTQTQPFQNLSATSPSSQRNDDYDLYGSPQANQEPVNISGLLRKTSEKAGPSSKRNETVQTSQTRQPIEKKIRLDDYFPKAANVVASKNPNSSLTPPEPEMADLHRIVALTTRLDSSDFEDDMERNCIANSTALSEEISVHDELVYFDEAGPSQSESLDREVGSERDVTGSEYHERDIELRSYIPFNRELDQDDNECLMPYELESQRRSQRVDREKENVSSEGGVHGMVANAWDENRPKAEVEQTLSLLLQRADFLHMQVIGQFNHAFILVRANHNLFMVDQHAADEKYNFEQLQRHAKVRSQNLLEVRPLRFGPVQEAVLMNNMDILNASGFQFEVDHQADAGARVQLSAVPVLHGWQFEVADIEECVSALTDFPNVMCRPAKLRRIFASRACRKSVMFGNPLNGDQMTKIIRHMATMDHPWNCPHGRPTIRHVCSLPTPIQRGLPDPATTQPEPDLDSSQADFSFIDSQPSSQEMANETADFTSQL